MIVTVVLIGLTACAGSDPDTPDTSDAIVSVATDTGADPSNATVTPSTDSGVSTTAPATLAPATTAPAATTPPTSPATVASPVTVAEPAAFTPIGFGDHEVGVATVTIPDPAGERPLTVDVWFPLDADVDVGALAAQQYTLLPGVYYESPNAYAATVEQMATDQQFPLIVYSHGSGGLRYIYSAYTETLASHGYIVVAPDHTGNTAIDRLAGSDATIEVNAFNRPTDVRRVTDAFVDPGDPVAGPFATHVDADHIVVTGHSFGGFTAIASVTGFSNEIGTVAIDDRIDAIVMLAPAVGPALLSDDLLSTIAVPFMVLVGTDDVTTPVDPNVTRLWDLTTNTPAYRVELVAGEHQTFTDLCAYSDAIPLIADVPTVVIDTITAYGVEGCSEGDIDPQRALGITTTYVLEFLDQVLSDGPPIDPGVVAPPDDVIFEARG